jgi:hypothetical protein
MGHGAGSLGCVSPSSITVLEEGREISFSFEDMVNYNGGGSPAGVALAYKVLELALSLLDPGGPVERREIVIETAFGGPGARDAFEVVTRAVTDERLVIDRSLARPENGRARERFVFRIRYRDGTVTLTLREGFMTEEFIDLTRKAARSSEDEHRLAAMKDDLARRVMSADPDVVYDVSPRG